MESLQEIFKTAVEEDASDIFITAGTPLLVKKAGVIAPVGEQRLTPDDTEAMIQSIFELSGRHAEYASFLATGDSDFSFSLYGVGRFRINAFKQRNTQAAVVRVVRLQLPDKASLGIPEQVLELSRMKKGMVLVTGPAGSGKSTTLACLIDLINTERNCHILTLEDPLEFLHSHKRSIVNQREVSSDTTSYATALRAAMRQSPDVMLVGEMRDLETTAIALTAAETGHLLFSTLHTIGAAKSIDRIIDLFPAGQQQQIRLQLASVLQAVVSQQLIPSEKRGLCPVFEIMLVNNAVRNLIREGKTHQLDTVIFSGVNQGMRTMDMDIARAVKAGDISEEDAYNACVSPEALKKLLAGK